MNEPMTSKIKAKKLGVMIRDARQNGSVSLEDCAAMIGVSPETMEAYELGDRSPSLPEIEILAYCFQLPLEHFWGVNVLSGESGPVQVNHEKLTALRDKIIGVLIRKGRIGKELSIESLAEKVDLSPELMGEYELGEQSVPVQVLEQLAVELDLNLSDFYDQRGIVGTWLARQRYFDDFMNLNPEMQAFICKPVNHPYMEIAQRLSEMPVERLRMIAEVLLDITL